jgi:HTH-type transcriptional regulator / antitoxin HigA
MREEVNEMSMVRTGHEWVPAAEPDYAIPPGETLRDRLADLGMSQAELATRTGLSTKHVNQILQGVAHISADTAQRLEPVTGIPARLWNRLEADYRSTLARLQQRDNLAAGVGWLNEVPVKQLVDRQVLPEEPSDKVSRIQQLLAFFGVATIEAWRDLWLKPVAAFRQSRAFKAKPGAVAAWLRLGELAAQNVACAPYDAGKLRAILPRLRALTVERPEVFEPAIRRLCAEAGVVVVFTREITGARVSGAMRWLTPTKALVQLSLRYKTDDQFWFTFFHELAHVLLHGKKDVWIEDDAPDSASMDDPREQEANRFAAEQLIPRQYERRLPTLRSLAAARAFSKELGLAPGVVIGRLQRDGILGYEVGNHYKRRLDLPEAE